MKIAGLAPSISLLGVLSLVLAGCGGGGSGAGGGQTPPAASVTSVALSCASLTVNVGQTSQCAVTVQGTGNYSSAVIWSVNSVPGGSAAAGTLSATGLYTAPATVPTPYTVTLTAASAADSTKSASFNIVVAGTIASGSQTISASGGGTITLPDGSSVTIPPGLLAADQTVTLTETSVPPHPPAGQLLAATGPALSLTFSGPLQLESAVSPRKPKFREDLSAGNPLAGIFYNFSFGLNSAVANTDAAIASIGNQAGQVIYQGISDTIDAGGNTAEAALPPLCLDAINSVLNPGVSGVVTITAYFVGMATQPPNSPTQGLLVWNPAAGSNGQFVSFAQCPPPSPSGKKTLVVIHGMLSSVEGSYASMLTPDFRVNGNYGSVFGIDYDWWNGLEQNGQTVAGFLDQVDVCEGGGPIDIMAHSEGVPVSLSALAQDTAAKSSVKNLIAIAGPVLGTPLANLVTDQLGIGRYALLAVAANLPSQVMVYPPATPGGLEGLLNDQFAEDLSTDTPGNGVLATFRNHWLRDPVLSQIPIVMVGGTAPGAGLQVCADYCFGDFQSEPFDGVVGLDSAFGAGLDLPLYRIPAFPLFHTAMVGDANVLGQLSRQLNDLHPPALEISTASLNASCLSDSHVCSGPPGSAFTLTGSGFAAGASVRVYVQDPTGTEDTPIPVTTEPDGTFAWTDATLSTKAIGTYGIWVFDPASASSNSVIETICSATCPSSNPPAVTVSIAPASVTLAAGATQSFTASVSGTTNANVSWSASGGTITPAGLYTAPAAAGTYSVTAASQADPSATAAATVTVSTVTITPSSVSVPEGGSQTFSATVSGGGGVTWSVEEGAAGGSITIGGIYTAPNAAGAFHIIATSMANSSESAMATVTVVPASGSVNEWTWMSGSDLANAPGVYGTQGVAAATNVPGGRSSATGAVDGNGNLWLFGGYDLNDLWEFNPTAKTWTWESGGDIADVAGIYGAQGVADPANMPGGRGGGVSWIDKGGNFWLFGGESYDSAGKTTSCLNDLWEFDPAAKTWTWVGGSSTGNASGVYGTQGIADPANVPGGRCGSASWIDTNGNLWLFGGASVGSAGTVPLLNDLWEFSPATKEWTWVSGADTAYAAGVYGTQGIASAANMPGSREAASSGIDSAGNLWLFGGRGLGPVGTNTYGELNDLWEFNPTTKEWTWVSGASTVNAPGVYGMQGIPSATNVPGSRWVATSWSDSGGNLWLFGGNISDGGSVADLNDLWKFNFTTREWTWVSGSSVPAQSGVYGTQGVPAPANVPGARDTPSSWIDGSGNLWLFGGDGYDSTGASGLLNDLWRYQP